MNITNKEYSIKKDAPFAREGHHQLVAIPPLNGILCIGGTALKQCMKLLMVLIDLIGEAQRAVNVVNEYPTI
jgi:hypothetical protein